MKNRFTEEQIIKVLKEHECFLQALFGERGFILCNKYYNWKRKYGDMNVSEVKRLEAARSRKRKAQRTCC